MPSALPNPLADVPVEDTETTSLRLRADVFDYFFRKVFAGEHGARSKIINILLLELKERCIHAKIQPAFDPTNESRVADVIEQWRRPINAGGGPPVAKTKSGTRRRNVAGGVVGPSPTHSKGGAVASDADSNA